MGFFLETLLGGLMSGMLYALIGLGFVLIFKASGVFNFAQGAMVLMAALSMARFSEWIPRWLGFESLFLANLLAFIISAIIMFLLAVAIERFILRHLVNQEATTLLMANLGISYFLDGLGQITFGSSVYSINVGMPKDPLLILESVFDGGLMINLEDLTAALVAALAVFFQYTSTGRALRAVADDHQAAQSIGIPLNRIWVVVWCVVGLVALVAGIIWGSKFGV
jgi:branched-chain amino acid transport system permease protein